MQWIVVSYVLTYASLLLGCGRLAELWGHRRMLSWGLAGERLAFLCCGLRRRFLFSCRSHLTRSRGRPPLCRSSGPGHPHGSRRAAGPSLRDLPDERSDWFRLRATPRRNSGRYLQLACRVSVSLFPAILLAILAFSRTALQTERKGQQSFDLLGALTLAGGVASILLAFSRGRDLGWSSPIVIRLLAGAALCFVGFIVTELRARYPLSISAFFVVRRSPSPILSMSSRTARRSPSGCSFLITLSTPLATLPRPAAFYSQPARRHGTRGSFCWELSDALVPLG